ncbi:DUF3084 domain-containing protein [Candidatus Margulisiibacteriota bacterium]
MFAFKIILLLIVVSGLIAYIGDRVGRNIGRKRLSIFGLRPRVTAVAITIISGVLIATITLTTFVILSREARLALFGLEELREKIISLESIKKRLEQEIEVSRKGQLLFRRGDVIITTLVEGGQQQAVVEKKVKQILAFIDIYLSNYGIDTKNNKLINISQEKYEEKLKQLSNATNDQVVQVKVASNVIYGEVIPIEIVNHNNLLIFQKDQEVNRTQINSNLSDPEIEQELKILLSEARIIAQQKGVIPDSSGSVGSIPYAEIFNTVKEIKTKKGAVTVKVVVNRPVYSIGPLSVSFNL